MMLLHIELELLKLIHDNTSQPLHLETLHGDEVSPPMEGIRAPDEVSVSPEIWLLLPESAGVNCRFFALSANRYKASRMSNLVPSSSCRNKIHS
jgi:hypothetical protein